MMNEKFKSKLCNLSRNTRTLRLIVLLFEIRSSEHVAHNFSERIEQHRLVLRLHDHQVNVNLLGLYQLDENAVVVLLGNAIRAATSCFDESFEVSVQELIDLAVVVIVVTDTWARNE